MASALLRAAGGPPPRRLSWLAACRATVERRSHCCGCCWCWCWCCWGVDACRQVYRRPADTQLRRGWAVKSKRNRARVYNSRAAAAVGERGAETAVGHQLIDPETRLAASPWMRGSRCRCRRAERGHRTSSTSRGPGRARHRPHHLTQARPPHPTPLLCPPAPHRRFTRRHRNLHTPTPAVARHAPLVAMACKMTCTTSSPAMPTYLAAPRPRGSLLAP